MALASARALLAQHSVARSTTARAVRHMPAFGLRRGVTWEPTSYWKERKPFEHVEGKEAATTRGTVRFFGGTTDGNAATLDFSPHAEHVTNIGPPREEVVTLTDLRHFEPPVSLACEGCEWLAAPTKLREEELLHPDKKAVEACIRAKYFDECAKLVQQRTGANKAVAYNWRHRRQDKDAARGSPKKYSSRPLTTFHMDNDRDTAVTNLRKNLPPEEAEQWLSKHWAIVNVWRSLGETVQQFPLGLLDAGTIDWARQTAPIWTRNNYKSHFSALLQSPGYKFYYVSNMRPDEVLLFKDFDSWSTSDFSGIAHGAFEDHKSPPNAALRRSIEVRVLVLYD